MDQSFYNSYIFKINVIEEWLFIVINFCDHFWSFIEKFLPSGDGIVFGIHTIRPCMSIPGTFQTATNYDYILIYFKYVNNTNVIHIYYMHFAKWHDISSNLTYFTIQWIDTKSWWKLSV